MSNRNRKRIGRPQDVPNEQDFHEKRMREQDRQFILAMLALYPHLYTGPQ